MKIGIPVKCQNNHKANWIISIVGLNTRHLGVPTVERCDCPKNGFDQGYIECGEPFVIEEIE